MGHTEIIGILFSETPCAWPLVRHKHDYWQIFCFTCGTGTFRLDNTDIPINPDLFVLVPPDTYHEISAEHTLLSYYEIKFQIRDDALRRIVSGRKRYSYPQATFAKNMIKYLAVVLSRNSDYRDENLDCLLTSLLLSVDIDSYGSLPFMSAYIEVSSYSKLTRNILEQIETSYTEQFSLSELAKRLGFSSQYMCTVFKRDTGITIIDYLNHIRILRACSTFYYSNAPVGIVAYNMGYSTTLHFTRVFKRLVGCTPSQFRSYYAPLETNQQLSHKALNTELFDLHVFTLQESIDRLREMGRTVLRNMNKAEASRHTESKRSNASKNGRSL